MTEFIDNLSSPAWWLSVVIIGLVINLIAAYLKPQIDGFLGAIFGWWGRRSEKQRKERSKRIELMCHSPHEQMLAAFSELRMRIEGLDNWFMGVLSASIAIFLSDFSLGLAKGLLLVSVVAMLMGLKDRFNAVRLRFELMEARNLQETLKKPPPQ